MEVGHRLQVHQYNDCEILEFFRRHDVDYELVGDHLFVIRAESVDMAAGPGDWLIAGSDGGIEVVRGDDGVLSQRAIDAARRARGLRLGALEPVD